MDYILQGRAALVQPPGLDSYGEAINSFERALALDPQSVEAKGWLANALVSRVLDLHPGSSWSDLKLADTLANEALAASPRSTPAHLAKGQLLRVEGLAITAVASSSTPAPACRSAPPVIKTTGLLQNVPDDVDFGICHRDLPARLLRPASMPMCHSIRRSPGPPALRSVVSFCSPIAHWTAPTTEPNSISTVLVCGRRKAKFVADSLLEGTGFELLVRGRGEAGCRALDAPSYLGRVGSRRSDPATAIGAPESRYQSRFPSWPINI
jgi:hypothetical protein